MLSSQLPSGSFSSRLVRLLSRLGAGRPQQGGVRLAARVGGWLDLGDAISLSAALNGAPGPRQGGGPVAERVVAEVSSAFARLRSEFGDAIVAGSLARPGKSRIRLPEADSGSAEKADFAPFHRYHLAMQGEMESGVRQLRARARDALAALAPAGASLAALDAAFDAALAERERTLLANVPLLLADRFQSLRGEHASDGFEEAFRHELREILLAELELRMLPVAGLIGALAQHAGVVTPQTAS